MKLCLSGRLAVLGLMLCSAIAVLPGCGGGGGDTAAPVNTELFTPNYIPSLNMLLHWNHLPMRVSFDLPSDVAQYGWDPDIYGDAANEWNQPGKQALIQVVASGQPTDVVVSFVDRSHFGGGTNSTGVTNVSYSASSARIATASVQITPVSPFGGWLSSNDAQITIAHELGHALGIQGHSNQPADLMYATFTIGRQYSPTVSDYNTIMTAYASYFGRGIATLQEIPVRGEDVLKTVTIE